MPLSRSEGVVQQMREWRRRGCTYREISEHFDIPMTTVRYNVNPQMRRAHSDYEKEQYRKNKEAIKARTSAYYQQHREQISKERKEARKKNPGSFRAYEAKRYERDADKIKARVHRYSIAHKAEHKALDAKRRALKQGTIIGATVERLSEITEIYRLAREAPKIRCYLCGRLIPKGHRHVDHIMPLSKGGHIDRRTWP